MCPPRMREKRTHQRFKQMSRISKEPLTRHRHLLDQGHGRAPAPHPPVKQECCQQPALHLHGLTVAQVSCHRSLHHPSHHYHCKVLFTGFLVPALFGSRLHLSEGCAFVWGMFVRGLHIETFVRVLRSSRVNFK